MPARCAYISLGSNQGDSAETIRQSLDQLNEHAEIQVVRSSSLYQTAAVGNVAGPPFLNAAAELSTSLPPLELLHQLQLIEQKLGRIRTVHWGPRTLDLDLLFYENEILNTEELTIPHPAAWYRRFVLAPLAEIAPGFDHPVLKTSIEELYARTCQDSIRVAVLGTTDELSSIHEIASEFPQIEIHPVSTSEEMRKTYIFILEISSEHGLSGFEVPVPTLISLRNLPEDRLRQSILDLFSAVTGAVQRLN
ncbi:MAG: 2-amino-4-hydroxy-6-hydroxymethyldihydropteridine diphosphokinase [Planctomycetaceae bacterium]